MKKNDGYQYRLQLDQTASGHTVLSFLADRFPHSSVEQWAERIVAGEVMIDGNEVGPDRIVAPGMVLDWNRPGWVEEETPQSFELVYEDSHLLAVSKPSGLPTLPGGGFYRNTLLSLVEEQFPGVRPLHRLGRATSGLVLFARTKEAASELSRQWPKIEKTYQALGSKIATETAYDILHSIGRVAHPRLGTVYAANANGKAARSVARPLSLGADRTIFEVDLHTGRPHQIRIHLACIGHPLVGDPMYAAGGTLQSDPGLPGDAGYLLHAKYLRFEHPGNRKCIRLFSEVPSELEASS